VNDSVKEKHAEDDQKEAADFAPGERLVTHTWIAQEERPDENHARLIHNHSVGS